MRSKKFPNLSNAISNDDLRPVMNYAVVQDGRIIATDGHILVNINLKIWIDDADELENLEGKIFNLKLLKKISKIWDQLIFEKVRIFWAVFQLRTDGRYW